MKLSIFLLYCIVIVVILIKKSDDLEILKLKFCE